MKTTLFSLLAVPFLFMPVIAQAKNTWEKTDGMYAIFETTKGKIVCRLFAKETPKTVANFIGLAEGTKQWLDPRTNKPSNSKLYDGLIFHRVIPNFMIQGGDPLGMGYGGPGFAFEDEIVQGLGFDKPGLLAMANSGPNTNGSQFFITQVATPWLTGHHTIFGEVVSGQEVIDAIVAAPRNNQDKPITPIAINKLVIKRVGKDFQEPAKQNVNAEKNVLLIAAPKDFRDEEYFETKNAVEKAGYRVITASLSKGEITGMMGGKTESQALIDDVNVDDYVAVVYIGGQGAKVLWDNKRAQEISKQTVAKGKVLGAICFAPGTLARAGVLSGKTVTSFPSVSADVILGGANYTGKHVEVDGKLITGSGPEAAAEFGQAIVKALGN